MTKSKKQKGEFPMRKKVLIPFLILLVALIGIVFYFKSSKVLTKSNDLKIETGLDYGTDYLINVVLSEEREKILKDDGQTSTGKYADITPDKKVRWDKDNFSYNQSKSKVKDIFNKISFNGKKISVPISFDDLGDEYKEFSKVDFSIINESMKKVSIENIKNKYKFFAIYVEGSTDEKANIKTEPFISVDVMRGDEYIAELYLDVKDNTISKLSSEYAGTLSSSDIRVDGIGVGNTFNEMYAKLGTPESVFTFKDHKSVIYSYLDDLGNTYSIEFLHYNKLTTAFVQNNFIYIETKPNIITSVKIYYDKAK
jgi:hypothetical protein